MVRYAFTPAGNGSYAHARVRRGRHGWRVSCGTWRPGFLNTVLLLARSVYVGLPSRWRQGVVGRAEEAVGTGEEEHPIPRVDRADLDTNVELFRGNLAGVLPTDCYLASVPRALDPELPSCFLAICARDGVSEVGVVSSEHVRAVFRLGGDSTGEIAGHVERVIRFAARAAGFGLEPACVVLLQGQGEDPEVSLPVRCLDPRALCPSTDHGCLEAVGVALAACSDDTSGWYRTDTEESETRWFRAAMLLLAAGLVSAALLVAGVSLGYRSAGSRELAARTAAYERILSENADIAAVSEENSSLAGQILGLESTLMRQSRWVTLLEFLSSAKPKTLHFSSLGSDEVSEGSARVRLGLAGWAVRQEDVTGFIGTLQKTPFLSDISLSSLERQNSRRVAFRITCSLRLYDI